MSWRNAWDKLFEDVSQKIIDLKRWRLNRGSQLMQKRQAMKTDLEDLKRQWRENWKK